MSFVGFYASRRFWSVDSVDPKNPEQMDNFSELMSEIIFRHECENFTFCSCRDGMFLLSVSELESSFPGHKPGDIEEIIRWWNRYLDYINCLYLLFESAVLEVHKLNFLELSEITRRDAFRTDYLGNHQSSSYISQDSYVSAFQMRRYLSTYGSPPPQFDPQFLMAPILPIDVFEAVAKKLDIAFSTYPIVSSLAGITKSLAEYKIGNYPTSLVLSWFIIESVVSDKWQLFIDSRKTQYGDGLDRVNSERKKQLLGRDYPVSVVSNILELTDNIPYELFHRIDIIRRYRNKVVHQDTRFKCTADKCREAINLSIDLVIGEMPLIITPNFSYSCTGT